FPRWQGVPGREVGDGPPQPPDRPAADPVTRRLRRTVTDLPAWDPLPPGEQLVRRPSGDL
ncbi:hypothetical protein P1P68_38585, partial [Streptomyces scabiei]|nr:hypothetical protein [Streptomyces scabiei]